MKSHTESPIREPRKKAKHFTLVEITLAIGIIAMGMVGVMALLPIGFNATRDAIGDNVSSDLADQFLHLMAMQAQRNSAAWVAWVGPSGSISETKPNNASEELELKAVFPGGATPNADPILPGTSVYATDKTGVFHAEAGNSLVTDFRAVIAVWKSVPRIAVYNTDTSAWDHTGYGYNQVAALNMEISWPLEKPYAQREKRYCYLEIFKPID